MRDRDHDVDTATRPHRSHQDDRPAPGKRTLTETVFRKASRDANGVAADADTAVARASGGSGHALPATLMRKFESSLGADLSSVRVHTGADSAAAAHAVGARAYALGQDIHFGAGHYDPGSQDGEHLLAHEVAHTVQQRGGTTTAQFKLEVSSAGDAAELEADRAADAMTRGTAFAIGGGGGGLSRAPVKIARDPNVITLDEVQIGPDKPNVITLDEVQIGPDQPNVIQLDEVQIDATDTGPANTDKMAENANKAEKAAQDRAKATTSSDIGDAGAVTVMNKQEADKVIQLINGDSSKLEQGIAAGDVKPSVRETNQKTVSALSVYSEGLGNDKFNLDMFQQQSQALAAEFARLHAQMMTLDKSGQASGAISNVANGPAPAGAVRGQRLGETVLDVGAGQSAATLNKDFKKTMTAADGAQGHSTNATAHHSDAEKAKKDMDDAAQAVARSGRDLMPKQSAAQAATANIKAMAAGAQVGKHQGDIDKLKADAAAAEEKVKLVGGAIKNTAAIAFAATDAKGPNVGAIVGAAVDLVTNLVAYTAKHYSDSDIEDEEEKKKVAKANEIFQRAQEAAKNAQTAVGELKNTATAYYENLENLSTAKKKYRDAMQLMGNSLDKTQGGNAFSITAQVLSEAEVYLAQSKLTIETGRNAVGKLPANQGGPKTDAMPSGSLSYFLAVEPPDKHTYFATRGSITLKSGLTGKGKDNLLGEIVDDAVAQLEKEREEIEALAKSLRAVFKV